MDSQTKLHLEEERERGHRWQVAYDEMVKPFIDKKIDELFEVFQEIPTSNVDGLVALKLQCNALESLRDEFQSHINTGILAQKKLEEKEHADE